MRDRVNDLVKKRESFRPFAPSVVAERAGEFFSPAPDSPFMLETTWTRRGAKLPAVTHVDGSARVQTVSHDVSPLFHQLLTAFGERTGYPVLLNTSFNLRGEPIVNDAFGALACFVRAELDCLVIGNLVLESAAVPTEWRAWLTQEAPLAQARVSDLVYTFF